MIRDDGRRVEERVTINQEFESLDSFVREYVANISRSGAFLRCNEPMPVGTRVRVKFVVIDDEIENVEGEGEVVRVQNDPPGMGVVFDRLDERSSGIIQRMMEKVRSGRAL